MPIGLDCFQPCSDGTRVRGKGAGVWPRRNLRVSCPTGLRGELGVRLGADAHIITLATNNQRAQARLGLVIGLARAVALSGLMKSLPFEIALRD